MVKDARTRSAADAAGREKGGAACEASVGVGLSVGACAGGESTSIGEHADAERKFHDGIGGAGDGSDVMAGLKACAEKAAGVASGGESRRERRVGAADGSGLATAVIRSFRGCRKVGGREKFTDSTPTANAGGGRNVAGCEKEMAEAGGGG